MFKLTKCVEGRERTSKFSMKLGPFQVEMVNMPKWVWILIGIGVMFFIILYGHGVYMQKARVSHIRSIVSKLVKGKALTERDVEILETLTPEERKKMGNDIKKMENNFYIELDGFKLEQNVPPGTPTSIIKDGEKVEIRKGVSDGEEIKE